MKRMTSLRTILLLAFVLMMSSSYGQTYAAVTPVNGGNEGTLADYNVISKRALKNFKKEFITINDARWYAVANGFISKFSKNGIQYRVGYNKNGHCLYTMRNYTEKQLPEAVRNQVKTTYFDYSVNSVLEISTGEQLVYLIHIANGKSMLTLRIGDDEMTVLEAFTK